MKKCHWEEIDGFRSIIEFKKFLEWINRQVESGTATKTKVKKSFFGEPMEGEEEWYVCSDCGSIWHLVYPDPGYFPGVFRLVELSEQDSQPVGV